ncbi:MAG: hypothetical protein ACETVW_02555 [Dehalococcoidia bacterium]
MKDGSESLALTGYSQGSKGLKYMRATIREVITSCLVIALSAALLWALLKYLAGGAARDSGAQPRDAELGDRRAGGYPWLRSRHIRRCA